MNLTRTAINRPVFILMLLVAAVLMGTLAYRSMRVELNPEVSFPIVTISTVYPGAGPEEVSELVSKRVEDAVSGTANLRELTSSSQEGVSIVIANFELGTDVDVALNDVRSRVDQVLNELPDETERPTVAKIDNSSEPVLTLAFASTKRDSRDLRDLLDEKLSARFGQISGVAEATVVGGDVREIQVLLDKEKLLSFGIGIADVTRQVQSATGNIPGGRITKGDQEFTVRVKADFRSVQEMRDTRITIQDPVRRDGAAGSVRLGDIAQVVDTTQERTRYARLNGKDTVILSIQKARTGNAVNITHDAEKLIESIKKEYPDLTIVKTLEQADEIENSLEDLNFSLYFAVFLVSMTVFVFLHNLRGTIIVALAIPACLFVALVAMQVAGFTINNLTMLALILAIGVLVDDAIVVLENIYRHLKMGEDPREAALNGRGEIGAAALAITLADVVVFLPIAGMGGIVGQFFKPLALTYVFAVIVSLFVSFTLTPMLAARWYKAGEDMEHPTNPFARWFERVFGKLENGYRRALEWALHHRWLVFFIGNSALIGVFLFIGGAAAGAAEGPLVPVLGGQGGPAPAWFLFGFSAVVGIVVFLYACIRDSIQKKRGGTPVHLIARGVIVGAIFPVIALAGGFFGAWKQDAPFKFEFIPSADNGQVSITIELKPGSSLAATEAVVRRVENIVKDQAGVEYVQSNLGSQGFGAFSGSGSSGSNVASVTASLYSLGAPLDRLPWKAGRETLRWERDTAIAAELTEKIGRVPGAEVKVSTVNAQGFGAPIQISLRGENRELLVATAEKVRNGLADGAVEGVINADLSTTPGKPEIQALPDRQRLADAGITASDVGVAMRTMYTGDDTAKFRVSGKEYDIRVQLSPKDRNDPNVVNNVPISFSEGNPIFLQQVATLVQRPAVDKIERRDREQEIQVTADLLPGKAAGTVQAQIDAWLLKEKLIPAGVEVKPLGQADAQQRETGFLLTAFVLGLVLVYILLASLYDNLLYPFIIQLSQPQAITGAILALVLTDKPFSLIGFIGLITLIGLVGKNAILLVDYTNTLRERGRNRHDALVEAGPVRLRPIAMTTIALVLGTMPIALALGRGSEFRETIGIVIIGGILLSTLLTLLVIPCSYTIFDDITIGLGRLFRRGGDKPGGTPSTPDAPATPASPEPVVRL